MYDEQPVYGQDNPTQETPKTEYTDYTSGGESPNFTSETPLQRFIAHQRRAVAEAGEAIASFIPPEVRAHGAEARKEFLAGFKVLIESAAATIETELNRARAQAQSQTTPPDDDTDEPPRPRTTGKSKVKIEVN